MEQAVFNGFYELHGAKETIKRRAVILKGSAARLFANLKDNIMMQD
jgi:hypothetical protein